MRILAILLLGAALAFAFYALATGPNLIEIIDNPKF